MRESAVNPPLGATGPSASPGAGAKATPGPRPWLVYGSRSFALTVADLVRDLGGEVLGMIDDHDAAAGHGAPWVGSLERVREDFGALRPAVALGIGYKDLPARWQAWLRLKELGWPTPALVHPQAYVARTARVGDGAIVMARAVLDRNAELGEASVMWPMACVNHDSVVGENCFLSPQANVCGHASIGAHSFVGAAAIVADHNAVPTGSFLKMGERYWRRLT